MKYHRSRLDLISGQGEQHGNFGRFIIMELDF